MEIVNTVKGAVVGNEWQTGLCGCCEDTGSCLDTYFCTSCAAARMCWAIDGEVDKPDCGLCTAIYFLIYNGGLATVAMILRYRIIAKYNLEPQGGGAVEGVISTFFYAQCCPLCTMCQISRQLTKMNMFPGGTCCNQFQGLGATIATKTMN